MLKMMILLYQVFNILYRMKMDQSEDGEEKKQNTDVGYPLVGEYIKHQTLFSNFL